ncbi:MAG: transposase [Alphaproteobacteria bacterium]
MTVDLTDPIFHDEDAARRHFEATRWPDDPICPHWGYAAREIISIGTAREEGLVDDQVLAEIEALGWGLVAADPPQD